MRDDATSAYDALLPRQRAFVTAYCISGNAAAAVRAAGYAPTWARSSGYALLRRPKIQAALDERRKELKLDLVSDELTNVLYAQMRDYMRRRGDDQPEVHRERPMPPGGDGPPHVDSEKPRRRREDREPTGNEVTVVSELIVETRIDATSETAGHGKPNKIVKTRFRHSEKLGARRPQQVQSEAAAETVDDEQRAKALAALLAKIKARQA